MEKKKLFYQFTKVYSINSTSDNTRREITSFKDLLFSQAKRDLRAFPFIAPNVVPIRNFFETGLLIN